MFAIQNFSFHRGGSMRYGGCACLTSCQGQGGGDALRPQARRRMLHGDHSLLHVGNIKKRNTHAGVPLQTSAVCLPAAADAWEIRAHALTHAHTHSHDPQLLCHRVQPPSVRVYAEYRTTERLSRAFLFFVCFPEHTKKRPKPLFLRGHYAQGFSVG